MPNIQLADNFLPFVDEMRESLSNPVYTTFNPTPAMESIHEANMKLLGEARAAADRGQAGIFVAMIGPLDVRPYHPNNQKLMLSYVQKLRAICWHAMPEGSEPPFTQFDAADKAAFAGARHGRKAGGFFRRIFG